MKGLDLIVRERKRQIEKEGWSAKHDDAHGDGELVQAARSYFQSAQMYLLGFKSFRPPDDWPWERKWWKPKPPLRDLVKAGALYVAEMDRISRMGLQRAEWVDHQRQVDHCALCIDVLRAARKGKKGRKVKGA